MARILLCVDDPALEIALLRLGHTVRRATLPRGALAVVNLWQFRRATAAFRPDVLMSASGEAIGAETAQQIGARHVLPPADAAFLMDHWLSPPFLATPARPAIIYAGVAPLEIPGAEVAVLTGEGMPPMVPEIAVLGAATPDVLAGLLGGGAVIVAPDTLDMRRYIADGITGVLYPTGTALAPLLARLVVDAGRRGALGGAARHAFLARHRAALTALRNSLGG